MTKKVNYKKIFKSKSKRRKTKRTKIKRKKKLSKRKKYNLRGGNNEYKVLRNTMVVPDKMEDTDDNKKIIFKKVLDRCLRKNGDYIIQKPPEEQNNTEQPIVCKLFVLYEFPEKYENYYYQLNKNQCKIRIFKSFIMDKPNGTYMLYEEDHNKTFRLFLKYDEKVTQHQILIDETKSFLTINDKIIKMSPPQKSKLQEVFLCGKIIEVIKLLKSEELLPDWPSDATLDTPIDNGIYTIFDYTFYHTYDGIVIEHSISVSTEEGKKKYNIKIGKDLIATAGGGRDLIEKLKLVIKEQKPGSQWPSDSKLETPITDGIYLINKTLESNIYHLYYTDQGIVIRIIISKLGEKFSSEGKTAESLLKLIEILNKKGGLNLKTSIVPKYRKHIELDCIHDGTNISLKTNGEKKINITEELLDQRSSEQFLYTDEEERVLEISLKRNRAPTDYNMTDFLFTEVELTTRENLNNKNVDIGFSDNLSRGVEIGDKVDERINFLKQFTKLVITL